MKKGSKTQNAWLPQFELCGRDLLVPWAGHPLHAAFLDAAGLPRCDGYARRRGAPWSQDLPRAVSGV